MTTALQVAQQQLADARAAVTQLKSERIAAESAVAAAQARKHAAKADQGAFRAANAAHADALADLERIGLLVVDAEVAQRDAGRAVQTATVKADEQIFATQASEALSLADEFAVTHGQYLAASTKLRLARERALQTAHTVERAASKAGVAIDTSATGQLAMAGDLVELAPSVGIESLRNKAHGDAVLTSLRAALGFDAPPVAPGYGFPPQAQVAEMIAGTYLARCRVIAERAASSDEHDAQA